MSDDSIKRAPIGNYQICYRDQEAYENILRHGENYEPHVMAEFRELIKKAPGFVDVGANCGLYVAMAKTLRGPDYPVTAIEANLDNAALLHKTINLNKWRYTYVVPVALYDRPGWVLGNTCWNATMSGFEPERMPYLSLPFDDLYLNHLVGFMKLDIEGTELQALHGMTGVIRKYHFPILLEYSLESLDKQGVTGQDLLQFLIDLGYTITVLEYKPGMRTTFTKAQEAADHIAKFTRICDIMAVCQGPS